MRKAPCTLHHVKRAWLRDKETRPMKSADDSLSNPCSSSGVPPRDARNHLRVILWSFVWAVSFIVITLIAKRAWWPFGLTVAAGLGTSLFGIATVLAYRRLLHE